jgi:YjbE family integral membrane protein
LRVALTTFAARMLEIPYLQIVGGVFILWIALKVIMDASSPPEESRAPRRLWQAIWYIVVADITMSTDNILAIAGASHGNFLLILFGLAVSIPFIVVSSNLLAMVMDRFPALIYLGSAILGQVGGEMILTDPLVTHAWNPSETIRWAIEAGLAIAILIAGRRLARRRHLP